MMKRIHGRKHLRRLIQDHYKKGEIDDFIQFFHDGTWQWRPKEYKNSKLFCVKISEISKVIEDEDFIRKMSIIYNLDKLEKKLVENNYINED